MSEWAVSQAKRELQGERPFRVKEEDQIPTLLEEGQRPEEMGRELII